MGCAPSHNGIIQILAKNAAKPLKRNKALLPPKQDDGITIPLSGDKSPGCYIPDEEEIQQIEKLQESHQQTNNLQKGVSDVVGGRSRNGSLSEEKYDNHGTADEALVSLSYQKKRHARKQSSTGSEQELPVSAPEGGVRRSRRSKGQRSVKQGRRAKPKQSVFPEVQQKVDFPEELVKAHQDAYAFLNPNLSKYEAVITMANQATQTHLIMQQMISFMALRFDEVDQCLGEIADDGEKLLKAVGNNLTWPLGKGDPTEQPDLLQQLLQYTVNKMQSLNCTVSSLTTNALQETCSFLQSSVEKFQEKLKRKEKHDERLLKMIKSLEDLAVGSPQSHPNDVTLYSEDSGIGGDSESIRGYRSPDKMGRQTSVDSSGQVYLQRNEGVTPQQFSINENKIPEPAVDVKSMSDQKESGTHVAQAKLSYSRFPKQTSLASSLSTSSLASTGTLEQDGTHDQESEDLTSSDESYDESEDDKSITSQITLPQRPLTSPAGTCAYKASSKWLENPENEEMTLKMKEAISEKIKFVPGKSNSNVWTREEVNSEVVRPSTADGSLRKSSKHRRSRSAESLRSQGEDPTLLELQRTQKELNKKLEQLYSLNATKRTESLEQPNVKSFSHTGSLNVSSTTSTNKLKACLDKSFNILPSQDRVSIKKFDKNPEKDSYSNHESKTSDQVFHPENTKRETHPTSGERKLEGTNISPRKSVRKLIQTFSPVDDSIKTTSGKTLGPLRCVRKFGVPVLPPTIPAYRLQPLDDKSHLLSKEAENTAIASTPLHANILNAPLPALISQNDISMDTTESGADDYENLPPPPLEILMDDSYNLFQTKEDNISTNINTNTCPVKKTFMSQKIKTSINLKNILPSKKVSDTYTTADNTLRNKEPVIELRKYSLESGQQHMDKQLNLDIQRKHEIEQAAHLYRQSHKIIHLQNPGDGEVMTLCPDGNNAKPCPPASTIKTKQSSPTFHRNDAIRRTSPTRALVSSPPTERKITSPPATKVINKIFSHISSPPPVQKNISPTSTPRQPSPTTQKKLTSPPTQRKFPSPTSTPRQPSPPTQKKLTSPPTQRKLPSPPQIRKQQSPPSQRKLPSPPQPQRQQSPPNHRRLPSPPGNHIEPSSPSQFTPSPPVSPSFQHKGLRRRSDEQQPSSKLIGNAQSIFCPSSTTLFETKSPSPPCTSALETTNKVSSPVLRHSLSTSHYGEQHRRVAMSAANPQPFVRRCYSDRRPRVQLRLPTSISALSVSDSSLHHVGAEEFTRKDSDTTNTPGLTDLRTPDRTVSHSELCVVGQGLQKE